MSSPPSAEPLSGTKDPKQLLTIVEEIYQIRDLDNLLEAVLTEARDFLNAEAGTLYLRSNKNLFFSFVQNEALFKDPQAQDRYIYSRNKLPLDKKSIAGYAATTGESLLIDNVYDIKSQVSSSSHPSL